MNNKIILATMLLLAAAIGAPKVYATPAGQVLAEILSHLDHKPTSAEKAQLQQMTNDSSLSEQKRTLAKAMLNMNHKIPPEDKPKVASIAKDLNASEEDRELANILLTIQHHPSASDKEKLQKLMAK